MIDSVHDNIVLYNCVKDILALIKPVEDDRSKRLSTIQELENCIQSLASLTGNLQFFCDYNRNLLDCVSTATHNPDISLGALIILKIILFTVCACFIVEFGGRVLKDTQ